MKEQIENAIRIKTELNILKRQILRYPVYDLSDELDLEDAEEMCANLGLTAEEYNEMARSFVKRHKELVKKDIFIVDDPSTLTEDEADLYSDYLEMK